jgi:hypothetical protein
MTNYIKQFVSTDIRRNILTISSVKLSSLSNFRGQLIWIDDGNSDNKPYKLNNDKDHNMRFTGLTKWYADRKEIKVGTKIKILFDETELHNNLHIIHIEYV